MLLRRIPRPSPSLFIAVLALLVALGGTVYATNRIDGRLVKRNSLPGDRIKKKSEGGNKLKNDTVTGTQVDEETLAKVPSSVSADRAAMADVATSALSANPPAYAHITPSGTVDPNDSLNLTDANVIHPHKGVYCLKDLPFKAHAVLVEVDSGDGPALTETSVQLGSFFICPSTADAEIVTYDIEHEQVRDFGWGFYVVVS